MKTVKDITVIKALLRKRKIEFRTNEDVSWMEPHDIYLSVADGTRHQVTFQFDRKTGKLVDLDGGL